MTPATTTRRRFLGRGAGALGLLAGLGGQPGPVRADDEPSKGASAEAASAEKLIARGVAFLRPRQDARGGWSTQREPGITALAVTALLRSGQVSPADPA